MVEGVPSPIPAVAHATRRDRHEFGKSLRQDVPRESQSALRIDPHRDPLPILTAADRDRLQSLLPERYARMAASAFAFYRGAAALMAHDFAAHPAQARVRALAQACGDCHLLNFGAFLTSEDRVLFDIDDFDETCPGVDFTLDLKRLATSVAVAAQAGGLPDKRAQALARASVKAYRAFMAQLAEMAPLDIARASMNLSDELAALQDDALETKMLAKLVKIERNAEPTDLRDIAVDAGTMVFVDKSQKVFHVLPDGEPVDRVLNATSIARYAATLPPDRRLLLERYALRDAAFKVVGVGSVGTYCAVALLATGDGEPLILQIKEASRSVLATFSTAASVGHEGQRVVVGQRAMQAASDPFLGWLQDDRGRHFYMRQLKNRQLGSVAELMEGKALPAYAVLCGRTLARAHARTGDPAILAGYMGESDVFDDAVSCFAMAYARQTVEDHAKLKASVLVKNGAKGQAT